MEEEITSLIKYLESSHMYHERVCTISLANFKNINMEEVFSAYPELRDKYAFLKRSRLIIDKKAARRMTEPIDIAFLSVDDAISLSDSGCLDNPNIRFSLRLNDISESNNTFRRFRELRDRMGDKFNAIDSITIFHEGLGVTSNLEEWSDAELTDLLLKVELLDLAYNQSKETNSRIKRLIYSNPELRKKFLVTSYGSTAVNIEKTRDYKNEDQIEFEQNPEETREEYWRKIDKFVENNRYCELAVRVENIDDIPESFLEKIEPDTNVQFDVDIEKEGKNAGGIYDAFLVRQTRIQLDELRKGIESGWTSEEIVEFLSSIESLEIGLIPDESLKQRIQKMMIESPVLRDKFLSLCNGERLVNAEKYRLSKFGQFIQFDKNSEDGAWWNKIITVLKNNPNNRHKIGIKSINDMTVEEAETLAREVPGLTISIRKDNSGNFREEYKIEELIEIRKKIEELTSGIDPNASELEKFCEVYKRVCESIVYDYQAAYPKTPAEEEYSKINNQNCRNLRNGLLEGKCVCAGYADILRNALAMVGVESEYVIGTCTDTPISRSEYERHKEKKYKYKSIIHEDGEMLTLGEQHAWVKVKIDGRWYNCDPTWDSPEISKGMNPKYCLISDKAISNDGKTRESITGPKCVDEMPIDKIKEVFKKIRSQEKIKGKKLQQDSKKESGIIAFARRIWERFSSKRKNNEHKLLNSGNESENMNKQQTEQKYPSWDLRNYENSPNYNMPKRNIHNRDASDKEKDDGR